MSNGAVLLVEDDPRLTSVLVRALRANGHEVVPVATVAAAREILASRDFSVAIIDINLPDQTGWGVIRWLRAQPKPAPKLIVMTAAGISRSRSEELKPDVILSKPFPIDALIQHLHPLAARAGVSEPAP
jgi:DNA-binding response OmpR family regulator